MTNAEIAELLALKAEDAKMPLQKALKRASRMAFHWPVEAYHLWLAGESLQALAGVGPTLARFLREWFEAPPPLEERSSPLRANFLTASEAQRLLAEAGPSWRARGDLQMHTAWSDGSDEIDDMADMARSLGYEYIAITDHAETLKIARGLSEERLDAQADEIRTLNARLDGFRVLRSLEVNLSVEGEADMEPRVLRKLDLVIGCFHSKLRLKDDQTERYLKAIRNPEIHILGHPRGRIYNFRLGLQCDWEKVFEEAARLDKAVEIDCYPDRQDLDVETLRLARQAGVRISLGTDAHAAHQLSFMQLGLAAAWKAGIGRDRILNFLSCEELLEWAGSIRA